MSKNSSICGELSSGPWQNSCPVALPSPRRQRDRPIRSRNAEFEASCHRPFVRIANRRPVHCLTTATNLDINDRRMK